MALTAAIETAGKGGIDIGAGHAGAIRRLARFRQAFNRQESARTYRFILGRACPHIRCDGGHIPCRSSARPESKSPARRSRYRASRRCRPFRSEEHTSELQSLMRISYAVFWLKK